jgi:hypothetical protein
MTASGVDGLGGRSPGEARSARRPLGVDGGYAELDAPLLADDEDGALVVEVDVDSPEAVEPPELPELSEPPDPPSDDVDDEEVEDRPDDRLSVL